MWVRDYHRRVATARHDRRSKRNSSAQKTYHLVQEKGSISTHISNNVGTALDGSAAHHGSGGKTYMIRPEQT
eukprot:5014047-Amphidinium_carterae.1